jgi:hypothetical protein
MLCGRQTSNVCEFHIRPFFHDRGLHRNDTRSTDSYRRHWALGRAEFPGARCIPRAQTKPVIGECSARRYLHRPSSAVADYLQQSPATGGSDGIGFGSSSTVASEKNPDTGETIAVKRFDPAVFDQIHFMRKIETLAKLHHPCLLRILGWTPPIGNDPGEIRTSLADNGSLREILDKVGHGARFPF